VYLLAPYIEMSGNVHFTGANTYLANAAYGNELHTTFIDTQNLDISNQLNAYNANIGHDLRVQGALLIPNGSGGYSDVDTHIHDALINVTLTGSINITGTLSLTGVLTVPVVNVVVLVATGDISTTGNATVSANLSVGGTADITGTTTCHAALTGTSANFTSGLTVASVPVLTAIPATFTNTTVNTTTVNAYSGVFSTLLTVGGLPVLTSATLVVPATFSNTSITTGNLTTTSDVISGRDVYIPRTLYHGGTERHTVFARAYFRCTGGAIEFRGGSTVTGGHYYPTTPASGLNLMDPFPYSGLPGKYIMSFITAAPNIKYSVHVTGYRQDPPLSGADIMNGVGYNQGTGAFNIYVCNGTGTFSECTNGTGNILVTVFSG
jgi:hypothetical protein